MSAPEKDIDGIVGDGSVTSLPGNGKLKVIGSTWNNHRDSLITNRNRTTFSSEQDQGNLSTSASNSDINDEGDDDVFSGSQQGLSKDSCKDNSHKRGHSKTNSINSHSSSLNSLQRHACPNTYDGVDSQVKHISAKGSGHLKNSTNV